MGSIIVYYCVTLLIGWTPAHLETGFKYDNFLDALALASPCTISLDPRVICCDHVL